MRKPILVTGAIRSGTTWVGEMLNASSETAVLIEPFNRLHRLGTFYLKWDNSYTYVTAENEKKIYDALRKSFEFKYDVWAQICSIKNFRNFCGLIRDYTNFIIWRNLIHPRPIMKDPTAIFSAEWLAKKFNMDVIVMIRHPAAFAWSYKRVKEANRFNDLLVQEELMQNVLKPFAFDISNYSSNNKNIIDQAILMWNIFYYVINRYRENNPDWLFVKHEELSINPIDCFAEIYKHLGLDFSEKIRKVIYEHTNGSNPQEAPEGVLHELHRNSKKNIYTWKKRLTKEEIYRVHRGTEKIAQKFYDESSWQLN